MRIGSTILAVALLASCSRAPVQGPAPHQIRIVGASAGLPFAEDAAERFTLSGNDTIAPLAQADGTAAGIARFCGGLGAAHPDLVVATRRMTPGERAGCAAHGVHAIAEVPFGSSALVLVGSEGAPRALSRTQAAAAIAGSARTWSTIDASLPATPILVYGPASRNGAGEGLSALLDDKPPRRDGGYRALGADAALVADRVAEAGVSVGLVPFAYAARPGLHTIALDGVIPSARTIASGRYALRLPLLLIVKSGEARAVPGMPRLLGLFAQALAPGGIFAAKGLVPLPPAAREATLRALASAGAAA